LLTTDNGVALSCRYYIMATGCLSAPKPPEIDGVKDFKGEIYFTGRWPHHEVKLAGKRVAVIGTGSSGIQAIPLIAEQAAHLTVFQRRPNWAAPLHNSKISKEEMESIKARYDEIYAYCATTPMWFIHQMDPRKTLEVPKEEREAFWEKLYAEPGFGIWLGNFRDIGTNEEAAAEISAFIANKIRQRVKDPKVAEKLIPKDHPFASRRVPLESGYFETYNRDNVTLVDTLNDEQIEAITPKGLRTTKGDYEFDILIYATGFDGVTGAFDRIDIRGKDGLRLKDAWAESPRTYLGMLAEGFPNMLMILGPHTARGNIPQAIEHSVQFQTGILRFMLDDGYTRVETRPEQVNWWTETVIKAAEGLISSRVDSWQTGVNRNVDGRQVRRVLGYNGNGVHFRRTTDEVAKGGYKEFAFR